MSIEPRSPEEKELVATLRAKGWSDRNIHWALVSHRLPARRPPSRGGEATPATVATVSPTNDADHGKRNVGVEHWRGALALPTGSVDGALGAMQDHWRGVLSTPGGSPIAIDPKRVDGYQPTGGDDEDEMARGAAAARLALGKN